MAGFSPTSITRAAAATPIGSRPAKIPVNVCNGSNQTAKAIPLARLPYYESQQFCKDISQRLPLCRHKLGRVTSTWLSGGL